MAALTWARVFDSILTDLEKSYGSFQSTTGSLRSGVYQIDQNAEGLKITIQVPGCGPEDVQISLKRGLLSVKSSAYTGDFAVNTSVTEDQITAKVRNGLLTIEVLKTGNDSPVRSIPVQAG